MTSLRGDEARELSERLLKMYYTTVDYPWTRHHIDSYDQFLSSDLPAIVRSSNPILVLEDQIGTTGEYAYKAEIFIGGMEGIIDEYELFSQVHPKAKLLPVASTGAGSRIIFEKYKNYFDQRLLKDFAYMALFRDLLSELIS